MIRLLVLRMRTIRHSLSGSNQEEWGIFKRQYSAASVGVVMDAEGETHSRTRETLNSLGGFI